MNKTIYIAIGIIILAVIIYYFFFYNKQPVNSGIIPRTKVPVQGTIQISNTNGAVVYTQNDVGMVSTSKTIPSGQQLIYNDIVNAGICEPNSQVCSVPSEFYKLTDGAFISKADVTILPTKMAMGGKTPNYGSYNPIKGVQCYKKILQDGSGNKSHIMIYANPGECNSSYIKYVISWVDTIIYHYFNQTNRLGYSGLPDHEGFFHDFYNKFIHTPMGYKTGLDYMWVQCSDPNC